MEWARQDTYKISKLQKWSRKTIRRGSRGQTKAQAEAVLITDPGNREARFAGSRLIQLPRRLPELHKPIPFIIPVQIFTACLADHKGI